MKHVAWTKRKSALTLTLCAIIVASTIIILQNTQTTQAAILVPPSPPSGLMGWWRFEEGSGTIAGDSSGNGNVGAIHGATWVNGRFGQCLNFDGSSSYVSIANKASLSPTQITLEAWIMRTSDYSIEKGIVTKGGGWGTQGWSLLTSWSGKPVFVISDGSGDSQIASSNQLPLNTWRFLAATYDGSNLRLFEDGILVAGPIASTRIAGGSYDVNIGRLVQLGGNYIPAKIDEVRIYNRALSAAEVLTDYQSVPGLSPQILAKIPKSTTQVLITLSWQGAGSINVTVNSPSQNYNEDTVPVYQKTSYSTLDDISSMLNIKRLSISVSAIPADQIWTIGFTFDSVSSYQITVETQK